MDANYIKSILSVDNVIGILSELDADYNFQSSSEVHFKSICHNSQSYKLYYYNNSKIFYCHRCGERWDIFGIVSKIRGYDFVTSIKFVCDISHIDINIQAPINNIYNWQKDINKFLPNYEPPYEPPKNYDSDILNLFEHKYHQSWLDDGISKASMDKFGIGWYSRNAQITIPVRDTNGNLIGIHGRNTTQELVDRGYKYVPVKTINDEYKFPTSSVLYGLYENEDNIKNSKSIIICEAPKSVLLAEDILDCNNTVALFGWNMQKRRRDMLLDYGLKEVNIALDRQYHEFNDDEFKVYAKQVHKIIKLFKPYCDVYTIWDRENRLSYKDSPFDKGKEIFDILYKERSKA